MLEQRRDYWDEYGMAVGLYDQQAYIPVLKQARPSLATVHSLVLQNVNIRVDLAFQAFFRRVKAGEKAGYPRFRGPDRYDSLTYAQFGNGAKLVGTDLHLSKIGPVPVVLHRPLEGMPKTVTIRRSSTGKWYAAFSCEWWICPDDVSGFWDVVLARHPLRNDARSIATPQAAELGVACSDKSTYRNRPERAVGFASDAPVCTITFSDVHPTDYFYTPVQYLACRSVVNGYADGTFRPYNNTTRGQLSKIIVLGEGWAINTAGGPHFSDVPTSNPFYGVIETAYDHGVISGYSDGTFRWGNNATRGQIAKIVYLALQP